MSVNNLGVIGTKCKYSNVNANISLNLVNDLPVHISSAFMATTEIYTNCFISLQRSSKILYYCLGYCMVPKRLKTTAATVSAVSLCKSYPPPSHTQTLKNEIGSTKFQEVLK